jgi:hypothetical protein
MRAIIDIKGQRFGRLLVLKMTESERGMMHWLCRCDCGTLTDVRANNLRGGYTKSCGCAKRGPRGPKKKTKGKKK